MKPEHKRVAVKAAVIAARILVGITFIISGWAKAIDPWGFVIKVGEYLNGWDWSIPHEAVVAGCVSLAIAEFTTGVLLITGCLRRMTVWVAAAFMALMLPLTLYIAIYDPVADCGCFGDLLIISNWATFGKNVILSLLIIWLLLRNIHVRGLYPAPSQWLVITASMAFTLLLSVIGYRVQPLVDFRPYKVGTPIFAATENADDERLLFEKNGHRQRFSIDELPDSSWTFVEDDISDSTYDFGAGISVYDRYGDDISAGLTDANGDVLYLIVTEVYPHRLTYDHLINKLSSACRSKEIGFAAVVGANGQLLDEWTDWRQPQYPVYSADPVALKQLVRGDQALVYTADGIIRWKMSIQSFDRALADNPTALANITPPDDKRIHLIISSVYLGFLLFILAAAKSIKIKG